MVRLDLGSIVLRRMRLDDIEAVKGLIKEGCEGTENRLILHLLTRPMALLMLATLSSILRCILHSFIMALVIPVFLVIVYLKITIPRSTGILGSRRPYWDYVGSSYQAEKEADLDNPYSRLAKPVGGKFKAGQQEKVKRHKKEKRKEETDDMEDLDERSWVAGEVWIAESDGEVIGCVSKEAVSRPGVTRLCRLVVQSWYRKEGVGRLMVQCLENREKQKSSKRVYAHVPYPSRIGEAFFRKLGYRLQGEVADGDEIINHDHEEPRKGWLAYPITKVFVKDL
ncbi:putative N-acetyltransferase 14 [Denticeps clupeoides]|uniref:Probable N-acetyltransferase 14 n=1 Tax=Denticeps clupeoides TaxID=299321 RepID=A0AAY4AIW0_9TELE|nr:N-acetyltransferase 14 [Denticeps clupeoides]